MTQSLTDHDPDIKTLLAEEQLRQASTITLIASENHCSGEVREACASVLTDKYAEGYPGARYYGGCEVADKVESLARDRAEKLFNVEHANVQPHSGTTANLAVIKALAGAGGNILGMALQDGGHLSHGYRVSHTGKLFNATHYGIDPDSGLLQMEAIRELALKIHPRVIIAGASSYPRAIDFHAFSEIAKEVGAYLMADIAHPAGLIAAGVLPSPVGLADVITMTTHKTLRGPRGGMILCPERLAKKIDAAVFPGAQGGPLMHQIAGKAVAFGEALTQEFRDYQRQVVENAKHMSDCLAERKLDIVTGGTDSHMVVVDLRRCGATGHDVETKSFAAGITLNKNMVPNDPTSPRVTSGIRVGTAAITSRGMGKPEVERLASAIADIIEGADPTNFRGMVHELASEFPLPD